MQAGRRGCRRTLGTTTSDATTVKEVERENRELKRANDLPIGQATRPYSLPLYVRVQY